MNIFLFLFAVKMYGVNLLKSSSRCEILLPLSRTSLVFICRSVSSADNGVVFFYFILHAHTSFVTEYKVVKQFRP